MAPSTPNGDITTDERTPLLVAPPQPIDDDDIANGSSETIANADPVEKDEPLGVQILLLCVVRLVEPIAFFSIFPFINKMIFETGGVDKEDVGYYSGLIESLFSATQMCVMVAWGRAADRIGRKPVLVFSLGGVTVATALFGLSKTLWQMILFRCLAGVFAGTIVTIRTMISENSTKTTQARAFSFFAFTGNIGILVGPFIGGALENPAEKFSLFRNIQFFNDYPYALPTFATAAVGALATIIAVLFIKESMHNHESKSSVDVTPPKSTWEILKYPGVMTVLGLFSFTSLLAFAYTAVLPVYLFTPVKLGGLSLSPLGISMVMGLGGLSQAVYLLLIFTPLHKRIGTVGVMRLCSYMWPIFFSFPPILNVLRRHHDDVAFYIIGPTVLCIGSGVAMAFTCTQLAINDISPSHKEFGTLNALALAASSATRAVIPALSTAIYAAGVRKHIVGGVRKRLVGGQLFWLLMVATTLIYAGAVRWLPKRAEGKYKKTNSDAA